MRCDATDPLLHHRAARPDRHDASDDARHPHSQRTSFEDGETHLFWQQSTDNADPQATIRYDVYVNGVLDHQLVAATSTVVYGDPGGASNSFEAVAVDSAGNESIPATLTTP
jgi:hypothetical protein